MPEVQKLWQTEGLFSDHYLRTRLRLNDWWPSDAVARPLWEFCKALYEKRAFSLRKYGNEMGTRQEFIDKIIEKFGFAWSDNLRLPETQQELEPDYLLYASAEAKEAVLDQEVSRRYQAAIAILEAKKFGHPLSQRSQSRQRYPHQQIRDYLNEAPALAWGILTNGNEWRLYCRDTKPSHFFAINFELAIRSLEEFKIFLALFSPSAFVREAQGKCRLDQVRASALAAQSELEADLRRRIFTVVEILANGFAARTENRITDADLPCLYENCLIFLYRLLFILYAEGRSLLPVEPKSRKYYKQLSLARLLAPLKDFTEYDSQTQTRLYRDIQVLCMVINGTDKEANDEFGVPCYNGGLFAPARHPLLNEWTVVDAVLADVLRQLMFTPETGSLIFAPFESVDYADLSVQQLGSIYEGLLEHRFVREDGKLVLKTDKGERKATGTYYTPDYVVKYIVRQTLAPLLQEIEEREPVKAARAAGKQDDSFANEVLKLNICDPAMGSGHFLVEATIVLADHIVYHPTTRFQADFVKGESQDEVEIAYWRRRVVETCIYGVDLNPLAIELAKLSLWLTTISGDQPLNFLDHHLCCGNSLIGGRLGILSQVPDNKRESTDVLTVSWKITENLRASLTKAVQMVHRIEVGPSASVGDVKNKERLWLESVRPALLPFRTVANLWTACFFGNELPQQDYEALIELLDIHPDKIRPWENTAEFQAIVMEAVKKGSLKLAGREFDTNQLKNLCAFLFRSERSAAERRFFHWELEFPEVFFNEDGTPRAKAGFDAVIGNPPYIPNEQMDEEERMLIPIFYPIATGKYDLSIVFLRLGGTLLSPQRMLGMIVPLVWQSGDNYRLFRSSWSGIDEFSPVRVVNLPFNVFRDAYIDTCIALFARSRSMPVEVFAYPKKAKLEEIALEASDFQIITSQEIETERFRRLFTSKSHYAFLAKFENASWNTLGELTEACQGPVESFFNYSERAVNAEYLPYANCDVYRYDIEFTERKFVHFGRKNPLAKFYTQPRILVRRIVSRGNRLMAITTDESFIVKKDLNPFILKDSKPSLLYILANLNSSLHSFIYTEASAAAGKDDFRQTTLAELQALPIRRIAFTTPENERGAYLVKSKQLYQGGVTNGNADGLLVFAAEQLAVKPERADVVHDLLAFLAERMTALNRKKRAIAKQLVIDLRDFSGIDIHSLKPKTRLEEFWKLEEADVFAHLRANKLRFDDYEEGKIRRRFLKAKDRLVPLETQIAFTDALIDQIVYRLYGLTPEEIQLVEDSVKC